MTLVVSSAQATAMALAEQENNPIMTWQDHTSRDGTTISSNRAVLTDGALVNAANGSTADFWLPNTTGVTSVTYQITRASAFDVNFIGIAAHNFGTYGATITPAYSTNGGSSWTTISAVASPTDNTNIGLYFVSVSAADWRITVSGFTAADPLQAGVIVFGRALTMPQRFFSGYAPPLQATAVDVTSNVTEGGNYVKSAYVDRGMQASVSISHLTQDFVRGSTFSAFQRQYNRGEPFFFAWRPTDYEDLLYCWRDGGAIVPQNMGVRAYMSFNMSLRAYDDSQ